MSDTELTIGIIGVDGAIGELLYKEIQGLGITCFGTTRRKVGNRKNTRFFDILSNDMAAIDLPYADIVYLCIGITSFKECRVRPKETFHINVTRICEIASSYVKKGSFVIFLSSSSVFSGNVAFPGEDSSPDPSTIYGMQKLQAELCIMKLNKNTLRENVAIVRITKLLSRENSLINKWHEDLSSQLEINPFHDLFVSPISKPYLFNSLLKIGIARKSGIFHLSNKNDLSYANIAYSLQSVWGYGSSLIRPQSIKEFGILVDFRPKYPSLGMQKTKNKLDISPQSLESFIDDLTT